MAHHHVAPCIYVISFVVLLNHSINHFRLLQIHLYPVSSTNRSNPCLCSRLTIHGPTETKISTSKDRNAPRKFSGIRPFMIHLYVSSQSPKLVLYIIARANNPCWSSTGTDVCASFLISPPAIFASTSLDFKF